MSHAIHEAVDGRVMATARARVVVDIGSTMVKIAKVGKGGDIESQQRFPRDFEAGIARQVEGLLDRCEVPLDSEDVVVCSSANGGLRIGVVCLSTRFSGSVLRNQVLLAGANPVFVHTLDETSGSVMRVDMLLVGGGIDCPDAAPMERRVREFEPRSYRFGALVYSGNRYLASLFVERFPEAAVIPNPLSGSLDGHSLTVFEAVRRAYLDDLVYKEGVSELRGNLSKGIRPTPEIVSRGFQRALANSSSLNIAGACVVFDIGGATTDLHYTVEIVRDDSEENPSAGSSVARYVFTDLGIVASRDSLLSQLRNHPRLYEFLGAVLDSGVGATYQSIREGDWEPSSLVLSYGCLFIAFDRFAHGRGPGLPTADLVRIAQIILTGGASQAMSENVVARMFQLFRAEGSGLPLIVIDKRYQLWVDGITWSGYAGT